ncbi:MAG: HAD family hydrolase [Acidobacteria bacterium]|nr:HAD family hydrolase [Acidobacteriota bacterium]
MPSFKPGELEAILFDVDGTLYSQRSLRLRLLPRLAARSALDPRLLRVLRAHRRALESLRLAESSHPIPDRQFQLTARLAGVAEERVRAYVEEWFAAAPLPLLKRCIRPGLTELLEFARGRGIRLGVFSDYPAEAKLKALDVREFFEAVTSAEDPEVQAYKPDPKGLLATLARLGVVPERALYVGDRAEVDAEAAARAGMRFLLLRGSRDCVALRSLL